MSTNKKQRLLLVLLVLLGVLSRTWFHIAPNVEMLTAIVVSAFSFLPKRLALVCVLMVLAISDLVIGNTAIFIFTWSGFAFMGLLALLGKHFLHKYPLFWRSEILAISSTLLFYLWTNLGVVLTTSMYSKDLSGLVHSYYNALPFLYNQLAGNVIFVPILMYATHLLLQRAQASASQTHKNLAN